MASHTNITKLMELVETPAGLAAEEGLKILQGIKVGKVTSEADKKLFLDVASALKKSIKKQHGQVKKIKDKWKKKIDAAQEKVTALKEERDKELGVPKEIYDTLVGIDGDARTAITEYASKELEKAEEEHGELDPVARAMLPISENEVVKSGASTLSFRDHKVVVVDDIDAVPEKFIVRGTEPELVQNWIKAKAKVEAAAINVQANGLVTIKIKVSDLPNNYRKIIGVDEQAIIASGGCDGVTVKTERRPVVK